MLQIGLFLLVKAAMMARQSKIASKGTYPLRIEVA
jgi:hypothetical protein